MKSKTLAILGICVYIAAVLSSITDTDGNFVAPFWITAISGISVPVFLILASVKLWRTAKLSIFLILFSIFFAVVFSVIQSSVSMLVVNLMLVVNFLASLWIICLLLSMAKLERLATESSAHHSDQ